MVVGSRSLALRNFIPPVHSINAGSLNLKPGKLPVESIQVVLEELRKKGGSSSSDSLFFFLVGFS